MAFRTTRELERENGKWRLRTRLLERVLIDEAIAKEVSRQNLDPALLAQVEKVGIAVDQEGVVVGAREAVSSAKGMAADVN